MKGFLHRIASSAIRTRATVHPFVESMFQPLRHEASEPVERDETVKVPAPARISVPVQPTSDVHVESRLPHTAAPARPSESAPRPERLIPTREIEPKPVVARDEEIPHGRRDSHTEPPIDLGFEPLIPEAPAPVALVRADSPRPEAIPVDEHRHESTADGERAEHTTPLVEVSRERQIPHAGPRVGQTRAQLRETPRPAPLGADDIQIHIGRIEVIAVQPPAPRPAPPPVRKAPGLDEYLSARNGRSR